MRFRPRRCRKVRYPERAAAAAVLALCQADGRAERRVYWCWQCCAWHLTSQALTDPPRAQVAPPRPAL